MMRSELQHFTFTRGKIYPNDWLQMKPYTKADEVDIYYAGLAQKAAQILSMSLLSDAFDTKEDLLFCAIRITCWFEDICSEIGVWRVVNETCKERYGTFLPFYGEDEYCAGMVNLQDIKFLLWDSVQTLHYYEGRLMNPENPAIHAAAEMLTALYEEEYETAFTNERLHAFVHETDVANDYYAMRDLLGWFTFRSYVSMRAWDDLEDMLEDAPDNYRNDDRIIYTAAGEVTFSSRHNLLSWRANQWCARIRQDKPAQEALLQIEAFETRPYAYRKVVSTGIEVRDMHTDETHIIDWDSFGQRPDSRLLEKEQPIFITALVRFCGKDYVCGHMKIDRINAALEEQIEDTRHALRVQKQQKQVYKDFLKASKKKPILFFENSDEVMDFYLRKMGYRENEDMAMPPQLLSGKNIILFADPIEGLQSVNQYAACVAAKDNPFYDKQYAEQHAHELMSSYQIVSYRLSCLLQDLKLLPDAGLNSILGPAHGRQFLHENAQFWTDYFFSCNRADDYDGIL